MARPLTDREKEILAQRLWPDGRGRKRPTLAQLGVHYGITKERVRQIEENGLRKLAQQLGKQYPFQFQTYEHDWRDMELWVTFHLPQPASLNDEAGLVATR